MKKLEKICILGGTGLVGSALIREFKKQGFKNILAPTRQECDLLNQSEVLNFFKNQNIDYLIMAAAKVGGIHANNEYRADFIYDNLVMETNVFGAAHKTNVEKFIFLGSSCIYPKLCDQPIKEEYLLNGYLEQTNEPYAIAKIAGLKMAENFNRQYGKNFFSLMPTNLYGENDNFHPKNSHVIPALIQRMHKTIEAGEDTFEVWGTGNPRREFLYVDDLANACYFLLNYKGKIPYFLNVGTGEDISIKELVKTLSEVMGFRGELFFNTEFPDGTPRKLLDVTLLNDLGWKHQVTLKEGLRKTIDFFKAGKGIRSY